MTLSLSRRADLWGTRTALVDASADRRVSYADLESEADAMARRLTALGVGPGDAVAILSRNRVETLALLFAVRRLGAVLAPVSHRLTPATVAEPLETVDPAVVVHEAAQRDLVREVADDVSVSFEELAREDDADYEPVDPDPEDSLLYLHETVAAGRLAVGEERTEDGGESRPESGDETGFRPGESLNEDPPTAARVVDLPASTVEWNCITAVAAWGLGRDDCAPALLPFSDADGLLRLTLPLLYVGGRVAILRAFAPEDALAVVAEEGATAMLAGATEYRELVACETFEPTDFGSVAWVGTRSALPADVRDALARTAPVMRTYGRAEAGPNDLFVPPDRASGEDDPTDSDPDRVGRTFPDCEARVVGDGGDPLPDGEVGELQFRGPVTARGYLAEDGADEATDEGGEASDDGTPTTEAFPEWVPAGDLAYHEDGDYYLLGPASEAVESADAAGDSAVGTAESPGRADEPASRRVHPRQVERALESREDVDAAGVVPDAEGVLAAFVGEADPGELRSVAEDALPEGATVRAFERAASLPRRPTGEVDRAELRRQLGGEERFDEE